MSPGRPDRTDAGPLPHARGVPAIAVASLVFGGLWFLCKSTLCALIYQEVTTHQPGPAWFVIDHIIAFLGLPVLLLVAIPGCAAGFAAVTDPGVQFGSPVARWIAWVGFVMCLSGPAEAEAVFLYFNL